MSNLSCQIDEQPNGLVMKLTGQITASETGDFEKQVKLVAASQSPVVVLDMSDLTFISSAGIGALLRLHKTVHGAKRNLRMAAIPADIANMLEASRLTDLFNVSPTVSEALA
jgi:anti-sigma B factor antagonist